MLLNRLEYALMNNPIRASLQRHVEAKQLLRMAGPMSGGRALEIGCGRGVGAGIVLDLFGADFVHAYDLDRRMVGLARTRLASRGPRARVWVADTTAIPAPDASYDAVFDFGILHHVPDWRGALAEVARVLRPGGRFYGEEVLAPAIRRTRRLFAHPQDDRFDALQFSATLEDVGFKDVRTAAIGRSFAWFVARRSGGAGHGQ